MRSSGQAIDSGTPINWPVLKQLMPYFTEFKGRIILALGFMVLAKLSTIALPFILKMIVDGLNPPAIPQTNQFLTDLPKELLAPIFLVFAYGTFRLANVVFGEIRDTLFSRVTERTIRRVSLSVFKHLHALDIDFHLDRRTGGLARDIERGTHGINFIMRFMVFNIIPTLIEISLVIGILLTNYGPSFGIITALSIAIYIAFSVIATNWRNKFVRATNEADSNSGSRAIDSLLNYETVKSFTNEEFECRRYDQDLKVWEKAKNKSRLSLFVLNGGQALIISCAITALLYLAVSQVMSKEITVGDFVLINAFMMQLFMPLNFLGFIYREIKVALINIEKMFGLLARSPTIQDIENSKHLSNEAQSIEFNNVDFYYQTDRKILSNINFKVAPKETVAIVGSSGAGKSTLVKLLMRFYDPNAGHILIGEQKLTQVTQQSLRKNIGIVPQDSILFNDTIMENVRYGNPQASDAEVYHAVEMAHLKDFIQQLPEGIKTQVGERGLKLSGGEKQRIAIARALLKNPPIMIFDEATSSLDSRSELAILEAIKEISANYTSVMIAHRLSTIIHADKIIVLDKGTIKESGNHQTLLELNGLYAELWYAQQKREKNGSQTDEN
ncbi:ABCB family ABC transporter ATP-binding protein/permease [Aliikangiella sp. IMCC44359]|uniref:ABCB family ABC transporter ATP-binding protein/permease n=1 Tax=Aliikangiella sp. IMCC44359 TaxID=3459125 RepID=UPI00403B0776